jgi:hypothetical protein
VDILIDFIEFCDIEGGTQFFMRLPRFARNDRLFLLFGIPNKKRDRHFFFIYVEKDKKKGLSPIKKGDRPLFFFNLTRR